MNSLNFPPLEKVLSELHQIAQSQELHQTQNPKKLTPENAAPLHLAISKSQGNLIYSLARSTNAKHIVEFGTSFGLSTLFLAAAAKDNQGHVFTSELIPSKILVARQNFQQAQMQNFITLLPGNALNSLNSPQVKAKKINLLFLDGWSNLHLPVFQLLENQFAPNALIVVDNLEFSASKPLIQYVEKTPDRYFLWKYKHPRSTMGLITRLN